MVNSPFQALYEPRSCSRRDSPLSKTRKPSKRAKCPKRHLSREIMVADKPAMAEFSETPMTERLMEMKVLGETHLELGERRATGRG